MTSKGLEALKEIKNSYSWANPQREDRDNFAIIEKELKEDEKNKQALEIIKPYINDLIGRNVYDKDLAEYFIETIHGRKFISKENYELLKEVLL